MVTLATDLDILNFSLTYEYLEFNQYQNVLRSGVLSGADLALVTRFSMNEGQHIQILTQTIRQLGGIPVPPAPAYNLPRITNRNDALLSLGLFCDTGASAYLGAAPLIKDKQMILVTGVNFHNIEAEQAAALRDLVGLPPSPFTVARGRTADEIIAIITPYLQAPGATPPPLPPQPVALVQGSAVPVISSAPAATAVPSAPPAPPATVAPIPTIVPPIIVAPVSPSGTFTPPVQPITTGSTGLPQLPFTPRRIGNG